MSESSGRIRANRIDVAGRKVSAAEIAWEAGRIVSVEDTGPADPALPYLSPGFVDSHVHIESSLLAPSEFARMAVRHGTVATVSDPHEIANVLGADGVRWMLADAARSPLRILFGAPSCVPATSFETAGATLDAAAVAELLDMEGVGYLAEVMNFPGVLAGDPDLLAKIAAAKARGLPVDGHAPMLRGAEAARYAAAGISTDHECSSLDEAKDKLACGMKILIREGSAARNFEALHPLLASHPGRIMFCTDDCHPDDLALGHINRIVARAVAKGHDLFDVLHAACILPQAHYGLDLGSLRPGDRMNAALLKDLSSFDVAATWIDGRLVAKDGAALLPRLSVKPVNRFAASPVEAEAFRVAAPAGAMSCACRVIVAQDGELLTGAEEAVLPVMDGAVSPDVSRDLLLIAVVNRYADAPPAVAFIRGFGLKAGAIASSVAHDSHNVVAVGCDAASLAAAVNAVIADKGGLALCDSDGAVRRMPLPIAGLMSDLDGDEAAGLFAALSHAARDDLGSPLRSPFMALSFMALLVIPALKLSDLGLFDGSAFRFTDVVRPD